MIEEQKHTNPSLVFIDTEVEQKGRILDIGAIKDNGSCFHNASIAEFTKFVSTSKYVCGHNIINHDIKYIGHAITGSKNISEHIIDTLYLSPLLFPAKPYHALVKDDKLQSDDANNPLNDAIKAKDLFYHEVAAFKQTEERLKQIFYLLLHNQQEFSAFFSFLGYSNTNAGLEEPILQQFKIEICQQVEFSKNN